MSCQGDAMKKGISFKLAVMTMVPLVVPVVMASIIHGTKKNVNFAATIKGT
jgi:hypothetical protein